MRFHWGCATVPHILIIYPRNGKNNRPGNEKITGTPSIAIFAARTNRTCCGRTVRTSAAKYYNLEYVWVAIAITWHNAGKIGSRLIQLIWNSTNVFPCSFLLSSVRRRTIRVGFAKFINCLLFVKRRKTWEWNGENCVERHLSKQHISPRFAEGWWLSVKHSTQIDLPIEYVKRPSNGMIEREMTTPDTLQAKHAHRAPELKFSALRSVWLLLRQLYGRCGWRCRCRDKNQLDKELKTTKSCHFVCLLSSNLFLSVRHVWSAVIALQELLPCTLNAYVCAVRARPELFIRRRVTRIYATQIY